MSDSILLVQRELNQAVVISDPSNIVLEAVETETIVSSAGQQGVQGGQGTQGTQGIQGVQGVQGIQGVPGTTDIILYAYTAGDNLSGHRIVMLDSTGVLVYADNTVAASSLRVLGMTIGSSTLGTLVNVQKFGELVDPSWNWSVNLPIYLGLNGLLTQVPPSNPAKFSLIVGFAISATSIFINTQPPIGLI